MIAMGAERITRRQGQRLFTEGAPAFTGYLPIEGQVELRRAETERGMPPVAVAGPGDLIGEVALLCETVRPATAVMKDNGTMLEIPRLVIRRVLEEYPPVASLLQQAYAKRVGLIIDDLQRVRASLLAIDGRRLDKP